jgi:magnesium-transporting ATPase (P-type)
VKDGKLKYAAQSPDEAALVSAAKNFGYVFKGRTQDKLTIDVHGETQEYEILNTIEFNSDRKRMSIIVRDPEGKLLLLCKGVSR